MAEIADFFNTYIVSSLEMLTMLYYFSKFLCNKIRFSNYLVFNALGITGIVFFSGNSLIQFSVFVFMLAIVGICFYKSRYDVVILYAVVTIEIMQLCYGIFDSLSSIISPLLFPLNPEMTSMAFMIAGNLMALLLSVFCYQIVLKYFVHDTTIKVQYALIILTPTLLIFLVSTYINFSIYGSTVRIDQKGMILNVNHYQMLFIELLGIASLFCVMFAYKKLIDTFLMDMRISLLEQESSSLQQYVTEAQMRYEKTKSFRHDVQNHMGIIRELLKNNQTEQALAYIGEMGNVSIDMFFPCSTNNPVLNILLENKLGIAKNKGVDVSCSLNVPHPCQIKDIDFCIILSNALDNAILACENTGKDITKYIRVTGNQQGDFLLIEIQNTFQSNLPVKEGIGLKNIRAVAEKYHGTMNIQTQGNIFTLSVLLIIPQQPDSISQQTD